MKTIASVAHSTSKDSFQAGAEMALQALSQKKLKNCDFAFVFASSEHNSKELLKGVKSVVGEKTMITGGTSAGIITNDYLGYEGFLSGIMVIASDEIIFQSCLVEDLIKGENEAGRKAGKKVAGFLETENPNMMLFFDMVRRDEGRNIPFYQTIPILDGIRSQIKEWPPMAGVAFATEGGLRKTEVWNQDKTLIDALQVLVLSGNIRLDTTIMHGMKPASDYHKITRTSGNLILEMDHKPALELITEYLGKFDEVDWKAATYLITIGVNKGEKYGPFKEEDYVNRMVLGIDKATGGLLMIEDDLKEGDDFQFMRRSIETDMVAEGAVNLMKSLNGRVPLFAFYISCLGRIKRIAGTEKEEGEEIQNTVGKKIPLLGIYSGTEIAKIRGTIMPLDWTGVLCIFSKPA